MLTRSVCSVALAARASVASCASAARHLHSAAAVYAPPSRAELLRKTLQQRAADPLSPMRSRVPAAEPEAPKLSAAEEAAAEAVKKAERDARRASVSGLSESSTGEGKKKKPLVETWTEDVIEKICRDILQAGRAALAQQIEAGTYVHRPRPAEAAAPDTASAPSAAVPPASPAASPAAVAPAVPALAEFPFPALNSFERWKVHTIAQAMCGPFDELSHATQDALGRKWIVLAYQPPDTEEGRKTAVEEWKEEQQKQQQKTQ